MCGRAAGAAATSLQPTCCTDYSSGGRSARLDEADKAQGMSKHKCEVAQGRPPERASRDAVACRIPKPNRTLTRPYGFMRSVFLSITFFGVGVSLHLGTAVRTQRNYSQG